MKKLTPLLLLMFIALGLSSQLELAPNFCPVNDSCHGAIEVPACTPIYFCNDSCDFEFYEAVGYELNQPTPGNWPGDPDMDNEVGPWDFPCHYINYDQWFDATYPIDGSGYLQLDIWGGDCTHPYGSSGNYGPLEGWVLLLWEGDECDNTTEIVWSTNCYWMTEIGPGVIDENEWNGIEEYDPTRQQWSIAITDAVPGQHYFFQIDSFSWCTGCGWFQWCYEPILMGYEESKPTIQHIMGSNLHIKPPWKVTTLLGQQINIEYNVPLIFYYKNDTPQIVIVTNN